MRVLLVEDDRMIGEAVRHALKDAAYAVDWVRDGQEALLIVGRWVEKQTRGLVTFFRSPCNNKYDEQRRQHQECGIHYLRQIRSHLGRLL